MSTRRPGHSARQRMIAPGRQARCWQTGRRRHRGRTSQGWRRPCPRLTHRRGRPRIGSGRRCGRRRSERSPRWRCPCGGSPKLLAGSAIEPGAAARAHGNRLAAPSCVASWCGAWAIRLVPARTSRRG
eukprot:2827591-Prymnesium_polylepis.1